MPEGTAHLTSVAGAPLLDSNGDRLGRVDDVVARLDGSGELPPLVGLKARIGGREMFVPISNVAQLGPDTVKTSTTKLNLAQFERRPGEVLLRRDVLDHSLINVETAKLVTAREVELAQDGGRWRVTGIDSSLRPRLMRLIPRGMRSHDTEHRQFIAWSDLEPFLGHVPSSRLKLTSRRLARLHPAQIADLVEAASHDEGAEILAAVGDDPELEADVFEELDDEHQVEFLKGRSDEEVAEVMARMETDDAADLLLEIEQDRRLPILNELPAGKQRKIRALLSHNPSTAGGLMTPDFVAMAPTATIADDELLLSDPGTHLGDLLRGGVPSVTTDADLPEVAMLMTDYNLIALPVVDADGRPVGLIGVDDVLEQVLPDDWRRRGGSARD
jgi:CBS domain-containing protein